MKYLFPSETIKLLRTQNNSSAFNFPNRDISLFPAIFLHFSLSGEVAVLSVICL